MEEEDDIIEQIKNAEFLDWEDLETVLKEIPEKLNDGDIALDKDDIKDYLLYHSLRWRTG
ncbi:MAG: hypothetical protein H7A23_16255 [Leptospiraceae bacterium]|nr:hypothetical protein [Leptospiraceae bacterium]MCP5496100.1 hypothetical protein [Leptospiraceae bacterium]